MQESSRIAAGKTRVSRAKRTVTLTAAGSFLVVLGLARATHPGSAAASSTSPGTLSPPTALVAQAQLGSTLSAGSIASSASSAPAVQTSTS
jgi:cytochrome c oxidase assembly factor CtaG